MVLELLQAGLKVKQRVYEDSFLVSFQLLKCHFFKSSYDIYLFSQYVVFCSISGSVAGFFF